MTPNERYRRKVVRGVGLLLPALRAAERGEWKPDEAHKLLFLAFRALLNDALRGPR